MNTIVIRQCAIDGARIADGVASWQSRASRAMQRLAGRLLLGCAVAVSTVAQANFSVPTGGSMSLGSGALDLGCTDLIVGGALQLDTAALTGVRNVDLQPGGTINGGAGSITFSGNWTNAGSFNAGTSHVNFNDACGVGPAVITGNTTFYALSLVSNSGKTFQFAAGSTQTITNLLTILGTAGSPLQIRSTVPGQMAFINLLGSQNIAHVGVSDNTATGAWLAPLQTNEGGTTATRWFGDPNPVVRIPTLSPLGMLILILLLGAMAAGTRALWQRETKTPRE